MTYLISKGYKNIAYSTGGTFEQKGHGSRRNQGFIDAMQAGKRDINPALIFRQMHTYKDGQGLAAKMLQMAASERPDAIFCRQR
nr:DNA-binding transcriptional repressor PurR [Raoultella sp. NCTC 9187]